jgi:tricorn protease-like protein
MLKLAAVITLIFSGLYLLMAGIITARGAWTPAIVFTRSNGSSPDIYLQQGEQEDRLTAAPAFEIQPALSPNGKWIVYVSNRDGNYELYRMRSDGSDVKRLTFHPAVDEQPHWIGTSNRIEFISRRDGVTCRYQIDVNGRGLQKWTGHPTPQPPIDVPTLPYEGILSFGASLIIWGIVGKRLILSKLR